jgi:tetratricopeptide (TPR) repeat protein
LSRRYDDAASAARRGCDHNPAGTAGVLLACQEADAHQAVGNTREAAEALSRAEQALASIDRADELGGIFACGPARQANYAISASLRVGAVEAALQHAERAELAWRDGDDWAFGTWAQVQIAAATAYIMDDETDRAAAVLEPVLTQPEEKFLATSTTRLVREVVPLLTDTRRGRATASLGKQIQDVCAARSAARPLLGGVP